MSCNLPIEKGVKNAADCKCYGAVMRAYKGMSNESHEVALEVAQRVYAFHHPEDRAQDANLTVERWVNGAQTH